MEWTLGDWITTTVRNKDTSSIAKVDLRYLADALFFFFSFEQVPEQAKSKWLRVKHTEFFNSTRKGMWIYWETSLFWARDLRNSASEYYHTVVSGRLDEANHFSPCGFSKSTLWAKFWFSLTWGDGWQLNAKRCLFFKYLCCKKQIFFSKLADTTFRSQLEWTSRAVPLRLHCSIFSMVGKLWEQRGRIQKQSGMKFIFFLCHTSTSIVLEAILRPWHHFWDPRQK